MQQRQSGAWLGLRPAHPQGHIPHLACQPRAAVGLPRATVVCVCVCVGLPRAAVVCVCVGLPRATVMCVCVCVWCCPAPPLWGCRGAVGVVLCVVVWWLGCVHIVA